MFCVDQLMRMEARHDPTVSSEDLARDKLAVQNETERLRQENVQRHDVSCPP